MEQNKINLPRILFISASFALVIIYLLSWVDVITDPVQRTASDFMAFYAAGRGALEHGMAGAYDVALIKANEEKVLGFPIAEREINFLVHPPLVLPILWLIARFGYVSAFYLWAGFLLILCGICAQAAIKIFQAEQNMNSLMLWTGTFLFFPLFISVVNGQTSAWLLLGVLLCYRGVPQNSSQVAGLGLALATISPQIALILAIPFFFNSSYRKTWWWFCVGGAILAGISIIMLGLNGVQNYLHVLSLSARGEDYKTHEIDMVNLLGMVKRLMPGLDTQTVHLIGWIGSLSGLLILCWMWWKAKVLDDRYISSAVIIAVFTSPHLHYHDLALLIVPLWIAIRGLVAAEKITPEYAVLIPFGISLILALTYSIRPLTYPIIYLLEVVLLITPWWLAKRKTVETPVGA